MSSLKNLFSIPMAFLSGRQWMARLGNEGMCSSQTPMREDENRVPCVHRTPVWWHRVLLSWALANVLHLCPHCHPDLDSKPFYINKWGLQGFPVWTRKYHSKYSACSYHLMGNGSWQSAYLACLPHILLPLICTARLQTTQCHCKHEQ